MRQGSNMMTTLEGIGFDTKAGVAATGDDEDFYLELVADFQQDYLCRTGEIRCETNIESLARFAHDLKSVLRMLGEFSIASMTDEWEAALRNRTHSSEQQTMVCDALERFSRAMTGLKPS